MNSPQTPKSIIGEDTEIVGTIKCASHIQIDGKLEGDLACTGNALIGNSAQIKGNLVVESVSVLGQVSGNLTARDKVELKSTARILGDVKSKRLTVEDGVTFVGKVEVNPASAGAPRPAPGPDARPAAPEATPEERRDDNEARRGGGLFGRK